MAQTEKGYRQAAYEIERADNMHYYEKVLGDDFSRLHPQLQARYSEPIGQTRRIEGTMHVVENGAALTTPLLQLAQPTKFMFAETGEDVPFILETTSAQVGDTVEIHWKRAFYFEHATRYYNTLMVIDEKTNIVLDYNGDGKFFASQMDIRVTAEGELYMKSVAQYIRIGTRFIQLPKRLEGIGMAIESFNEQQQALQIAVSVYNPIIGVVKQYRGIYDVI